jgi:hypothetical protein
MNKTKVLIFLAKLGALLAGIASAAAAFFFLFLPKHDKQREAAREAKDRAEGLKRKVEQAKAERAVQVEKQVAAVKEEVAAQKEEDPVDFANALINEELRKKS